MAEYIDRTAAMTAPVLPKEHREHNTFNLDDAYEQGYGDAIENIKHIPAADVAPIGRVKWVDRYGGKYINSLYECSLCEGRRCTEVSALLRSCPIFVLIAEL